MTKTNYSHKNGKRLNEAVLKEEHNENSYVPEKVLFIMMMMLVPTLSVQQHLPIP